MHYLLPTSGLLYRPYVRMCYICYHRAIINSSDNTVTLSILNDSQWLSAGQALSHWQLPPTLQDWLFDPGSLTSRLQAAGTDFGLQVLQHSLSDVSSDELQFMQRDAHLPCQVREVLLCDQHIPWVFARSVIPQAADGLLHRLQHIGDRPLGQALFTHADVSPGPFEVAVFEPDAAMGQLNTELTGQTKTIYGRRRVFWVDQAPVLVAEVFLSRAPCYNLSQD